MHSAHAGFHNQWLIARYCQKCASLVPRRQYDVMQSRHFAQKALSFFFKISKKGVQLIEKQQQHKDTYIVLHTYFVVDAK